MRINRLMLFLLLLGCCHIGYGQEQIMIDTVGVKVYFRQGYSTFEPAFRDNASRLDVFVARLREANYDTLRQIRSVRIIGAASPEGVSKLNERLSAKRAENLIAWFEEHLSLPGLRYDVESRGVDWKGLTLLVEDSDMPYRNEVLDILLNTPVWVIRNGKVVDSRHRQLGMLHGGRAWRYMEEHFFPELRSAGMEVYCEIVQQPAPVEKLDPEPVSEQNPEPEPESVVMSETASDIVELPAEPERKPFYMALKTNMLYDVALIPNLGIEFYLGKGWTVGGNWMYAWWNSDKHSRYWRTYGGELDIRKYLGRRAAEKPLTGHHLGLYGQMLTYDFELGSTGYLGDKWSWGVGVEYGYSLPVARRLNIDFSIGIGYLGGEYKKYDPVDTHYVWRVTKQRHWFGPTKAEISLVWLIGRGNYNKGKGGAR